MHAYHIGIDGNKLKIIKIECHKWKDNIKMCHKETGCDGGDLIEMTQIRV
jgi:hypothetical protein